MNEAQITVIKPTVGWQLINWKELKDYRDLFYFLVWRDVKIQYKQTVLGFMWAIIQPVFNLLIMTVIFGGLAKVPSDDLPYAIFNFSALLPWLYFQNAVTMSAQSLVSNANMITKVYFPRLIVPMAPVLAKLIDFGIGLLILIGLMIYYQIWPSTTILLFPVLLLLLMMTTAGMGMWLTALAVQYRDIKHVMNFFVQLLKFVAPVIWAVSSLELEYGYTVKLLYGIFPLGGILDGFRSIFLAQPIDWWFLGISAFSTVLIFVSGLYYFRRTEKNFADVA